MRAGERPSWIFWFCALIGSTTLAGFIMLQDGDGLRWADAALLIGVAAGGVGYAEGGRLARSMGGWQVICWALVLSASLVVVPVVMAAAQRGLHASPLAWLNFAYLSLISQFVGFFAWYRGMALAGIARVGQLQLLQPFFTLLIAALLLDETVTPLALATALVIVTIIALQRKTVVRVPAD